MNLRAPPPLLLSFFILSFFFPPESFVINHHVHKTVYLCLFPERYKGEKFLYICHCWGWDGFKYFCWIQFLHSWLFDYWWGVVYIPWENDGLERNFVGSNRIKPTTLLKINNNFVVLKIPKNSTIFWRLSHQVVRSQFYQLEHASYSGLLKITTPTNIFCSTNTRQDK